MPAPTLAEPPRAPSPRPAPGRTPSRPRRTPAALALLALVLGGSGCFGYNRSAKRWAYVGDSVLILGGGGAIAADVLTRTDAPPCMGSACPYESPITGAMVAGTMLVTAGIVGIVVNATRPNVKTSR